MITVESLGQVKGAKRKLRLQMKNYSIRVKDVAAVSSYHMNTVSNALNPDIRYWNPEVVRLVEKLIETKKVPAQ